MIADVLQNLDARLRESASAEHESEDDGRVPPGVQELIAAAISELQRVLPVERRGGVAPVLGSGVVQQLLRVRREAATKVPGDGGHFDGRG
jgi:hypothetical protein